MIAHGRYLGYPLLISEREVVVYRPDGKELVAVKSLSTARRFIRGYRGGSRKLAAPPYHGEAVLSPPWGDGHGKAALPPRSRVGGGARTYGEAA